MYNKKILIAEDEKEIAAALETFLREEGFQNIEHAPDGIQTAQKARKFKPDLILFDVEMPGWHKFNALMRLKLSIPDADIPFIVTTGLHDEGLKEKFMEAGAKAFFNKPFKPEALIEAIKAVFNETGRSVQAGS